MEAAGPTFDALADKLEAPWTFLRVNHDPNGTFPNGLPNPLLPENRAATAAALPAPGADLGSAWDGDFDRCFFFDETGAFLDGEYVVALLAQAFCAKEQGARIVYDPRVIWSTLDAVRAAGGQPVASRVGHSHIKSVMRENDAAYGGEMSAHHYFRDFMYCDSGMIPWLLVAEIMSTTGKTLASLVEERTHAFPCSGEINRTVADAPALIAKVEDLYAEGANTIEHMDGLSLSYDDWRFNLRMSNTEPVVRLNVESRGDAALMQAKTEELLAIIDAA